MSWFYKWVKTNRPDIIVGETPVVQQLQVESETKDGGDLQKTVDNFLDKTSLEVSEQRSPLSLSRFACPYKKCSQELVSERAMFFHVLSCHMNESALSQSLFCPLCRVSVPHFVFHLKEKHASSFSFLSRPKDDKEAQQEQADKGEAKNVIPISSSEQLKPEELKIEEPKIEEPKIDEPKIEESKIEEPKPEELKPEESNVDEPKAEEPKIEEPKPEEPKAEESKNDEPKIEELKPEESKIQEPKPDEPKIEEPNIDEPKPEEPKIEEPKIEELKIEEPKPEEPKAEESKNDEPKIEELKPEESKIQEPKPEEPKIEEAKIEVDETKNVLSVSSRVRSDEEVKGILMTSFGRRNQLTNSLRSSFKLGDSWDYSDTDSDSYFDESDSEHVIDVFESLFDVTVDPGFLIPHNIDINVLKKSIDQEISFLPPIEEIEALNVLEPVQRKALKTMTRRCKTLSEQAYPRLLEKCKNLSIPESDLKRALRYIRDEAPLIIHVHLQNLLGYFLNDTHYRNQFETNSSNGLLSEGTRKNWEDRMFHKTYSHAKGADRVKYGVLNVVNDPRGIQSCSQYGDSFFILKNVRLRATFADRDSGYDHAAIATCEYYCHVFEQYTNQEIQSVVSVAKKIQSDPDYYESSDPFYDYKEIQLHGPVTFKDCVKSIRVCESYFQDGSDSLKQLLQFCQINNITDVKFTSGGPVFTAEQLLSPPASSPSSDSSSSPSPSPDPTPLVVAPEIDLLD